MQRMTRRLARAATALMVVGVLGTAGTAAAKGTGNGFQPLPPPDGGVLTSGEDCGVSGSIVVGDVYALKIRESDTANGHLIETKGALTVDAVTDQGDVVLNELDDSGKFTEFDANDGSATLTAKGPNLLYPLDDVEAAAWAAAGLPPIFYFARGTFTEHIDSQGNVTVVQQPRRVQDFCDLLVQPGAAQPSDV